MSLCAIWVDKPGAANAAAVNKSAATKPRFRSVLACISISLRPLAALFQSSLFVKRATRSQWKVAQCTRFKAASIAWIGIGSKVWPKSASASAKLRAAHATSSQRRTQAIA
ncbi:hypothetical protein BOV_0052 [Brucella ovis ATCC 25840]|uniref:Uncharacterized protein n=1 Tax=Brucella ovis (strain ATCC 25840 / 63/290 / NCTC 10512) TaxID=444178 RepID=A0A0H3ARX2_BRUO2|nr:hypothetical protein BOV_0052 [Brucella ovis ATCC 25840]